MIKFRITVTKTTVIKEGSLITEQNDEYDVVVIHES